jgi:hypothetical protein
MSGPKHASKLVSADGLPRQLHPTGSVTATEMVYVAEADELMEADVGFQKGRQLTSKSCERLAEHGPADGSWQALLGLPPRGTVQQKPSKRIRR